MERPWTLQEIQKRLVRYPELRPCTTAFIDTRTPGSQQKENFTIIGPGVAENPDQYVHIDIPHGFNIGGARQPPGCVNSQHSHETAEVFVVHRGRWKFTLGEHGDDGDIELGPGDTISIPTQVFRGFTNVGDDVGFLFAVLGGDDPGNVTWAPYVFEQAKNYGLVLLENGSLVDTQSGESIPDTVKPMPPTTQDDVLKLRRLTSQDIATCVMRADELSANQTEITGSDNAVESAIIGGANEIEGISAGKMAWNHGFHVRQMQIAPGGSTLNYRREEAEVILMHQGCLDLCWSDQSLALNIGDVITVPVGMTRSYRNHGDETAIAYVVRGGDQPKGFLPENQA